MCAYLTERADQGMSYSTITGACSAIGYRHRDQGLADPTAHQVVARVRRGLRRIVGVAPRRQARPLTTGDVRQILTRIDRATAPGARDAALILLGFSATLRRSELVALELRDVASKPAGLLLTVRRSKADPHSAGQIVAVAAGRHADTDPVAALEQWLVVRGAQPGPLLTRVRYPDRVTCEAISGQAVATVIRSRAEAAGLPGLRITGHSLRAGHATTAAMAGVGLDRIAAQTRHCQISILVQYYIRPLEALADTSSRGLGL